MCQESTNNLPAYLNTPVILFHVFVLTTSYGHDSCVLSRREFLGTHPPFSSHLTALGCPRGTITHPSTMEQRDSTPVQLERPGGPLYSSSAARTGQVGEFLGCEAESTHLNRGLYMPTYSHTASTHFLSRCYFNMNDIPHECPMCNEEKKRHFGENGLLVKQVEARSMKAPHGLGGSEHPLLPAWPLPRSKRANTLRLASVGVFSN